MTDRCDSCGRDVPDRCDRCGKEIPNGEDFCDPCWDALPDADDIEAVEKDCETWFNKY